MLLNPHTSSRLRFGTMSIEQLLNEAMHQLRLMLDDESARDKVAKLIAKEFEGWRKYLLNVVPVDEMMGSFSARKLIYAVSRLLIETLREPDAGLENLWWGLTMGQTLSVPMLVVGLWLLIGSKARRKRVESFAGSASVA